MAAIENNEYVEYIQHVYFVSFLDNLYRPFLRMTQQPNIVSVKGAAREKGVSRQAVYRALDEGRLTEVRMEGIRLIQKDSKYQDYAPRPYADKRKED